MDKKIFANMYGMVVCPCCNSYGYIQNPERNCCSKCGGFGFVIREPEKDRHTRRQLERGEKTSTTREGETYKSLLDGTEFVVKRIAKERVLLQSKEGNRQIVTQVETLKIKSFYQEKEEG